MRDVSGRRFWKMSGSGNDFVFFDARDGQAPQETGGHVANPLSEEFPIRRRNAAVSIDLVGRLERQEGLDAAHDGDGSRSNPGGL